MCRRTLPIFDGHQRFDLKLEFKRMDKVTADKGYAGPVVVCSLRYEPIVGHSPSKRGCWSKEAQRFRSRGSWTRYFVLRSRYDRIRQANDLGVSVQLPMQ